MSRRIAIVEDEAAIRDNYSEVFKRQGYEVLAFAERRQALATLREHTRHWPRRRSGGWL